MKPNKNQYVRLIMKNLVQVEGYVLEWTDQQASLLTNEKDIIIVQNTLNDVSIIKILSASLPQKKQEIASHIEQVIEKPAPIDQQSLKLKKLSELRMEQAKIDKEIISSNMKNFEINPEGKQPVKYDQFSIFKKR